MFVSLSLLDTVADAEAGFHGLSLQNAAHGVRGIPDGCDVSFHAMGYGDDFSFVQDKITGIC